MYDVKSKVAEEFIHDGEIVETMEYARANRHNRALIEHILDKAEAAKGITHREAAVLLECDLPDLNERMFALARRLKERIYGNRIVMFAPLYLSNYCINGCTYCPYHAKNKTMLRKQLSQKEIETEVIALQDMGHKRLALEAGEHPLNSIEYILESIRTIYNVKHKNGAIRRVNVNIAATTVENYRKLAEAGIGTYILFQETYNKENYQKLHPYGPKSNYAYHTEAMDRAMEGGIDDVGIGLLYGLYDWRFETLALMAHIAHLEERFGVGCHTISVPRIEPAIGSDLASRRRTPWTIRIFSSLSPYCALPCRTRALSCPLGKTRLSGSGRWNSAFPRFRRQPYQSGWLSGIHQFEAAQFQLGDHRSLAEVIADLGQHKFIPSFCTGCYRLGRTGKDFMDLAKPGLIKEKCAPNALSTFEEYLLDYGTPEAREAGERAIAAALDGMDGRIRKVSENLLAKVRDGRRDVYC